MKKQTQQGLPTRKKNAWWRKSKHQPYVLSEGKAWYGCNVPGAWVWLESNEEAMKKAVANDAQFKRVSVR